MNYETLTFKPVLNKCLGKSAKSFLLKANVYSSLRISLNPLFAGELFHCYMLEESTCHFRDVRSILLLLVFYV